MSKHRTGEVECLARYLGRHGITLLRPVLLAIFGALAWLLWLAGPSQASDLLPTLPPVPAVPSVPTISLPAVSLPAVPVPAPIVPIAHDISSVIPSPKHVAALPETMVDQLPGVNPLPGVIQPPGSAVPPLIAGLSDPASSLFDGTVGNVPSVPQLPSVDQLPYVPQLPSVPELPPVPGALVPPGVSLPADVGPAVPESARARADAVAPPDPVHLSTGALSPAARGVATTSTRNLGFIRDELVVTPAAMLATTEMSPVPAGPPPGKPFPPAAPPRESDSTSESQGGSGAHGAADLPEQRALAPPFHNGPIPDGGPAPAAEPAFDPGSSPD
jgi:hypothetical protein